MSKSSNHFSSQSFGDLYFSPPNISIQIVILLSKVQLQNVHNIILANYNALLDCLFVRIIIHYVFVFRDALLALLICPFVIIFILYWVETT